MAKQIKKERHYNRKEKVERRKCRQPERKRKGRASMDLCFTGSFLCTVG